MSHNSATLSSLVDTTEVKTFGKSLLDKHRRKGCRFITGMLRLSRVPESFPNLILNMEKSGNAPTNCVQGQIFKKKGQMKITS